MGGLLSSAALAYQSSSALGDGIRPANVNDWRRLEQALQDHDLRRLDVKRSLDRLLLEAEKGIISKEFDKLYQPPAWLGKQQGFVNVAVAGNSGAGKSSFINAARRMRPRDPGAAKVGVNETTMEPTAYEFAGFPNVRLWDLPGAGTESFPREVYIQTIGLRHFDIVIVISSQRFTETEVFMSVELRRLRIPYFMVRSKVDIDVANNASDLGVSPEETLRTIREEMQRLGVEHPYLVSSRQREGFEMKTLLQDLTSRIQAARGRDLPASEDLEKESPAEEEGSSPARAG